MKTCSKCGVEKSEDRFYRLSTSKDGRRPDCKDCSKKTKAEYENMHPVMSKCKQLGHAIITRTKTKVDHPSNKCYKENKVVSEIGDTGIEIAKYLYTNFYEEIETLINDGKTPSVDRIDSTKNYAKDNIRIVDFRENYLDGVANAVKKTSKQVKVCYPTGEEEIFDSVSVASRKLGIKRDTIIRNRDNRTTSRKGYTFHDV